MAEGPETKLTRKMRKAGAAKYGTDLVTVKYHGSAMGEAGVSDLLCCLFGVFIAAEVKAPDNYGSVEAAIRRGPTVKQKAFIARIIAAGGVAGVVADVEGFMALLDEAAGLTLPPQYSGSDADEMFSDYEPNADHTED